jgi:DNA helicase-2/ATP-dependent DNA helicase PcrA
LFEIPESLRPIASRSIIEQKNAEESNGTPVAEDEDTNSELDAWNKFILTPFSQIKPYTAYVKGLEFPRVLVVMDDDEARGFLFSYDKLFGVKGKTTADIESERTGKDTGIDRTKRLFYVTCSRAEISLAIVAYSSHPDKVRDHVVRESWFEDSEVEILT